jgi:hypothetical protein
VDCFHSAGTHDYIKYLKYGYGKATDHACREIRLKRMTREEGIAMVQRYDAKKPKDLPLFLRWIGMTEEELLRCLDDKRDPSMWQRDAHGEWIARDSVANHAHNPGVEAVRLKKEEECRFIVMPSREPAAVEDEYVLMGRGYIDKYNYQAMDDTQGQPS